MHVESDRREKVGSVLVECVFLAVLLFVQLASELCTRAKFNHAMCFRYMQFTED